MDFWTALLSGGVAGTVADVTLYPLDTLKTRLQAPEGFIKAGGFKGTYKGLGAAAAGSAPGAAFFFAVYEMIKANLSSSNAPPALVHMLAASFGETVACSVRVPTEVIKQRMQTSMMGYNTVAGDSFLVAPCIVN
jgi:solute carrier family 25 S-adenosylmethionine transporter 26